MRGTQPHNADGYEIGRFIPACAGNTALSRWNIILNAVHPRVCGEHQIQTRLSPFPHGSSPRVRGTRRPPIAAFHFCRFIPACAGNTKLKLVSRMTSTVHPRVCGEHSRDYLRIDVTIGSSPRVRGTRYPNYRSFMSTRFIPACAGNTLGLRSTPLWSPVHPRVCGEHEFLQGIYHSRLGSSPRVRGTQVAAWISRYTPRFIPACAGNTTRDWPVVTTVTVHPRVCGEHVGRQRIGDIDIGSSPRVRGTLFEGSRAAKVARFIPACAGNTSCPIPTRNRTSVHPRVCGEHQGIVLEFGNYYGSSPRVRGTRDRRRQSAVRQRFIPACAGNTA